MAVPHGLKFLLIECLRYQGHHGASVDQALHLHACQLRCCSWCPTNYLGKGLATVDLLHRRAHCGGVFPFPDIFEAGLVPPGGGLGQSRTKWPSLPHRKQELGFGRVTKLASSWFRVSCCRFSTSHCWSMWVIRTFCCFCISSAMILCPEMRTERTFWCLV